MSNKPIFLLLIFAFVSCQFSQSQKKLQGIKEPEAFESQTSKEITYRSGFYNHNIGFVLYDPESKKMLEKQNASKGFIPASTNKVPTVVAALSVLGAKYRFKTRLSYRGIMGETNGILDGNLYLRGGGDPSLAVNDLLNFVMALKKLGVKKVLGDFVYDETYYHTRKEIEYSQNDDGAYNSGISSLAVEYNTFRMNWQRDGDLLDLFSRPSLALFQAGLTSSDIPEDSNFIYQEGWKISNLPKHESGDERLPVKDPGRYVAILFKRLCEFHGIKLNPPKKGWAPKKSKTIYIHKSPKLIEMAGDLLEFSNNMMTEMFLLKTARILSKKKLNLKDSAKVVSYWYKKQLPEIDWKNNRYFNGSGLSIDARFSPQQMLGIYQLVEDKQFAGQSFISLLPISGWKGTLRKRMLRPNVAFRVWAKTGTVSYGSALAGYLFSKDGKRLIFVINVHDLKKRKKFDALAPLYNEAIMQDADRWIAQARRLQDNLLANWIDKY